MAHHLLSRAAIWTLQSSTPELPADSAILPDDGTIGMESVFGKDKRRLVEPQDFADGGKFRSIVKIQARFNSGNDQTIWMMGTGWLVSPDTVVTAGHVVYDWRNRWQAAIEIKCFIGYSGLASVGTSKVQGRFGEHVVTTAHWVNGNNKRAHDVAFLKLNRPFTGNLRTIPFQDTPTNGIGLRLGVVGYPGDKHFQHPSGDDDEEGAQMYEEFTRVNYSIQDSERKMIEYHISTFSGQSGAPILQATNDGGFVSIGTHCYGGGHAQKNSGTSIGGDYGINYVAFMSLFDSGHFPYPHRFGIKFVNVNPAARTRKLQVHSVRRGAIDAIHNCHGIGFCTSDGAKKNGRNVSEPNVDKSWIKLHIRENEYDQHFNHYNSGVAGYKDDNREDTCTMDDVNCHNGGCNDQAYGESHGRNDDHRSRRNDIIRTISLRDQMSNDKARDFGKIAGINNSYGGDFDNYYRNSGNSYGGNFNDYHGNPGSSHGGNFNSSHGNSGRNHDSNFDTYHGSLGSNYGGNFNAYHGNSGSNYSGNLNNYNGRPGSYYINNLSGYYLGNRTNEVNLFSTRNALPLCSGTELPDSRLTNSEFLRYSAGMDHNSLSSGLEPNGPLQRDGEGVCDVLRLFSDSAERPVWDGPPLLGPLGGVVGIVAGSILSAVGGVEFCSMVDGPFQAVESAINAGAIERAVLAEAALQALLKLEYSTEVADIFDIIDIKYRALSPQLSSLAKVAHPYLTEYGLNLAHRQLSRVQNCEGASIHESFDQIPRESLGIITMLNSRPSPNCHPDFIGGLLSPTRFLVSEEDFLGSFRQLIIKGIDFDGSFLQCRAQKAIDEVATLLTMMELSKSKLDSLRVLVQENNERDIDVLDAIQYSIHRIAPPTMQFAKKTVRTVVSVVFNAAWKDQNALRLKKARSCLENSLNHPNTNDQSADDGDPFGSSRLSFIKQQVLGDQSITGNKPTRRRQSMSSSRPTRSNQSSTNDQIHTSTQPTNHSQPVGTNQLFRRKRSMSSSQPTRNSWSTTNNQLLPSTPPSTSVQPDASIPTATTSIEQPPMEERVMLADFGTSARANTLRPKKSIGEILSSSPKGHAAAKVSTNITNCCDIDHDAPGSALGDVEDRKKSGESESIRQRKSFDSNVDFSFDLASMEDESF
ncbi:ATP synthase F1 [Colletotrichum limetticola]|uniref:Serine protease n=1 Tax=Colletotrichum limetticola TaxID=1209924 RepID=A0ABQ9PH22_9PEZI|nr:ATP synthase F1 [Colletotrichum limetticola]